MSILEINPKYRAWLEAQGLKAPVAFFAIHGVILWGHPNRTVQRVVQGSVPAYLKTEQRVPWRERWRNAWAGFGFISKSLREWALLNELQQAGIGCPEVIAAGEEDGRAFLMVREVEGSEDLRRYLQRSFESRRTFFVELGRALARMHRAGFLHPDLFSKHVLVTGEENAWRFAFVDWQRGEHGADPADAWRSLAKLEATLAEDLATPRERALCLRAYLRTMGSTEAFSSIAKELLRASRRLQQRRQVQETRQPPLPAGMQQLVRIDDTMLYVTRDLPEKWVRNVAELLNSTVLPRAIERQQVPTRPTHDGELIRRRSSTNHGWFARTNRPGVSPDFENAAKLFRLQRFGVATARLLAVGNRPLTSGETISFLLTELPSSAVALRDWCQRSTRASDRHRVLKAAAKVFRRIHGAGYFFDAAADVLADQLLVNAAEGNSVLWRGVEHLRRRFPLSPNRIRKDLALLDEAFAKRFSRSDRLRFLRDYLNLAHLTFSAKNLARSIYSFRARSGVKGRVRA